MRVPQRRDLEVRGVDSDWTWGVVLHASERMGMGSSIPMSPPRVAAVYAWCHENGYSLRKIRDLRDVVSIFHRFGGHGDPTEGRMPRRVLREIARSERDRGRHGSPRTPRCARRNGGAR